MINMGGLYNFVNNYLSRKGNGKSIKDLAINIDYLDGLNDYIVDNGELLANDIFYITDANKVSEILKVNILDFINYILHINPLVYFIDDEYGEGVSYVKIELSGTDYCIKLFNEPFIIINEDLSEIKFIGVRAS